MNKDDDYEVALGIKMPASMREQFKNVCREQGTNSQQVVRTFIREYLKSHSNPGISNK